MRNEFKLKININSICIVSCGLQIHISCCQREKTRNTFDFSSIFVYKIPFTTFKAVLEIVCWKRNVYIFQVLKAF